MPDFKALKEDLDFISDQISNRVRSVAAGIIAIVWAVLLVKGTSSPLETIPDKKLSVIAGIALLAMLFDFAQFLVAYWYTNRLRKTLEASEDEEIFFDETNWLYKLRIVFFWTKQVTVVFGGVWLLGLLWVCFFQT